MGLLLVNGAQLMCSFGIAPSALVVLPQNKVISTTPAANILDMKPMANIMPFGMCTSLSNPTVASATTAALGVLTPMPCIPSPVGAWIPGSTSVLLGGAPAVDNTCKLTCAYGGMIQAVNPGQTGVTIG